MAVFSFPVLVRSVTAPTPVLNLAAPLLRHAYIPNAELYIPVTPARASSPSAVLPPGKAVSGVSVAACALSAKQANKSPMRVSAIDFLN